MATHVTIDRIIRALKEMGVQKVAPSHCTGKEAILRFKKAWGENFIPGGCGAQLSPYVFAAVLTPPQRFGSICSCDLSKSKKETILIEWMNMVF